MPPADLIYGINPVLEAMKSGRAKRVFISTGRREKAGLLTEAARAAGVQVEWTAPEFFNRFPAGHQSVAARVREQNYFELSEILERAGSRREEPLLVALDGVEDPRNLGAIMRSALSAGAHGMVLQSHRQAAPGPETYKASAGAAEYLPVSMHPNIKNAIDELKGKGLLVIGAEAGAELAPWEADLRGPAVLVLGGEASGIRKVVLSRCDLLVRIPFEGRPGSLNVSVAAGILLYEIIRQRRHKIAK